MKKFNAAFLTLICLTFAHYTSWAQGVPTRQEANIDLVYDQYNLNGDGVVIAIIDRGIDYRHTDFIDENGNTRILYIYDMINPAGANDPDNPYGIGTIFDESEINAALGAGGDPITMDRFGHGTATSGITGGDGSGTLTGEFHGFAPDAQYIIVKAIQDYFPAFDDQPGQDGFYNPTYIPVAFQFIEDKLSDIDKPSVTLLNMGSINGPTDGTSTIARRMTDFANNGNALVCGVGDDGGNDNHASATIGLNETVELRVQKEEAGNLRFDLWYDEADRFEVTITRPDNSTEGPFPSPATADDMDDRFLTGINYYHRGANTDFHGATSDRRELMIDFTGETGEHKVTLKAITVNGSGKFHATLNPSRYSNNNKFLSHVVEGYSLNDFTAAENVISPSDYVVKNDWVDMGGNQRQMTGQGDPGEIWIGSSWGPTQDERMGIDFAACGEVLYAAYSPNTWYSHFDWLLLQGGESKYGIQNAVSAAAPLTTGVIALMLEMNPNLTPETINEILRNFARSDSFTGSVPNNKWGYGKLDALAAIKEVETLDVSEQHINDLIFRIYPNPAANIINLDFGPDPASEIEQIIIFNSLGQQLFCGLNRQAIAGHKSFSERHLPYNYKKQIRN